MRACMVMACWKLLLTEAIRRSKVRWIVEGDGDERQVPAVHVSCDTISRNVVFWSGGPILVM